MSNLAMTAVAPAQPTSSRDDLAVKSVGPRALDPSTAEVVARGLAAPSKWLPSYLFYDDRGSRLFGQITRLPEYYLTRAERSIFEALGDRIARQASPAGSWVLELGAGGAEKSQILLSCLVRLHSSCDYQPADVSWSALRATTERLGREAPLVRVRPLHATHQIALREGRRRAGSHPLLVLFIGSSIGNYTGAEAVELLQSVRAVLGRGGALLLGTDLRKSPDVLVPAYDDTAGVTAAFNKNLLVRLNRELAADFNLDRFRHVAVWNELASRVEMHLESTVDQMVRVAALGRSFSFGAGERIHTESSHKYDDVQVVALLRAAGLEREQSYTDADGRFAVHLARQR